MKITKSRITRFQADIFSWWKLNKRDLPWRHTRDPYKIAVSEIMLQQTQVSRVLARYSEFIEEYPTVFDLSRASPADILRIWKGMGYNRRALYLHKMAKIIVGTYSGIFPEDEKLLAELPGLGKYTARAILVFAYNESVACVDTNIRKIITHFFFNDIQQKPGKIQEVADQLVPLGKSWKWHQALMDYGAIEFVKLNRPERSRGTSIPYKNSNRFYRGKIIDLLRERDWHKKNLIQYCCNTYQKNNNFIEKILLGLQKDGLIVESGNSILLPT